MKGNEGLTLVEVLVASSIILIFLSGLVAVFNVYLKMAFGNTLSIEAAYLAEEGIEATRLIRDQSWATYIAPLSTTTTYYLNFQPSGWQLSVSPSTIDGIFTRTVRLGDVFRNSSSDIIPDLSAGGGGALDLNAKKVTVTLSWQDHGSTTSKVVSTYLTNLNGD